MVVRKQAQYMQSKEEQVRSSVIAREGEKAL